MSLKSGGNIINSAEYMESLRRYKPRVFVDSQQVDCVAGSPQLMPGINAAGGTYEFAQRLE